MLKVYKDLTSELRQISTRAINGYEHIVKPSYKDKNEWPNKKMNLKMLARQDNLNGGRGTRNWGNYEIICVLAGTPFNFFDHRDGYNLDYIRTVAPIRRIAGFGSEILPRALSQYGNDLKQYMAEGQYEKFVVTIADIVEETLFEVKAQKYSMDFTDSLERCVLPN